MHEMQPSPVSLADLPSVALRSRTAGRSCGKFCCAARSRAPGRTRSACAWATPGRRSSARPGSTATRTPFRRSSPRSRGAPTKVRPCAPSPSRLSCCVCWQRATAPRPVCSLLPRFRVFVAQCGSCVHPCWKCVATFGFGFRVVPSHALSRWVFALSQRTVRRSTARPRH